MLLTTGGRLWYVQRTYGDRLRAMVEQRRHGRSVIPARRGMIFDARGRVVALSRQVPDVFVDPALVEDGAIEDLARRLSVRLDVPPQRLARLIRLRRHSRYVVVARGVDEVTARAVRAMHEPAVGLTDRFARFYPLGESMAHVLGWVGRDGHGLAGIEQAFDDHLRGKDGRRDTLRDARRHALERLDGATVPPVDGGHVVLTIDAEIQRIVEDALDETMAEFAAWGGVVVAMDPRTGEVLAMASRPAFDPNEPVGAEGVDRRRNRALTDPVEPGSTFKPLIAAAALELGFVSPEERIDCGNGVRRFPGRTIRDTRPNGILDLKGIITRSSNIGMALIGQRMGKGALYATLQRYGFGQPTGIECAGEGAGLVHPLSRWSELSVTSIPMGYEVLVTPLQLAAAYAALLNDGVMLRPRLVKELLGPDGSPVRKAEGPEPLRRVVSKGVARYVTRELLVSVVENGGGKRARIGPHRVLGKTGTAKLVGPDGRYEDGAYLSLFVGASPVDRPRLVVVAMVRRPDPARGFYGSQVAAPLVGRILAETLAYLGVPPDDVPATGL